MVLHLFHGKSIHFRVSFYDLQGIALIHMPPLFTRPLPSFPTDTGLQPYFLKE